MSGQSNINGPASLDVAASIDPIIVSADPEVRRSSAAAFQVRDASGAAGAFRSVFNTVTKRWGFSTIDGSFTPGTTWDAETEGGDFFIRTTVYSDTPDDENEWVGRKARGTKAAPLALLSGDCIFEFEANGYDGVSFSLETANIAFEASENFAVGAHGTRQVFRTANDGEAVASERMRLHQAGALLINRTTRTAGLEYLRVGGPVLADVTDLQALRVATVGLDDRIIGDTVNGRLGVNQFTGGFTPLFAIHVQADDALFSVVDIDGFSGSPTAFQGRVNAGTPAVPAAVGASVILSALAGFGHDGAGFGALGDAAFLIATEEAFTPLAHGTQLQFYTTPLGATLVALRGRWTADGTFIVGTSTGAAAGELARVDGALLVDVTALKALRVTDGALGDFFINDTTNRRVGIEGIAAQSFNPSFPLHAEYEGTSPLWVADLYSGGGGDNFEFVGRRARGTKAAPATLVDDDDMWEFSARGYDGVAFSGQAAAILFEAAGGWTALNHGTRQVFKNTDEGTTTLAEILVLGNDNCVIVTGGTGGLTGPVGTEVLRVNGASRFNGDMVMSGDFDLVPSVDNDGDVGTAALRWTLVRAVTITAGDLTFENGWRFTEDYEDDGMVLKNRMGREMFAVRESGLYIGGRKVKALSFEESFDELLAA